MSKADKKIQADIAFKILDKDRDGYITREEFKVVSSVDIEAYDLLCSAHTYCWLVSRQIRAVLRQIQNALGQI